MFHHCHYIGGPRLLVQIACAGSRVQSMPTADCRLHLRLRQLNLELLHLLLQSLLNDGVGTVFLFAIKHLPPNLFPVITDGSVRVAVNSGFFIRDDRVRHSTTKARDGSWNQVGSDKLGNSLTWTSFSWDS